jgi:homoserine O-acetyltransferase/O-succinyltransferase
LIAGAGATDQLASPASRLKKNSNKEDEMKINILNAFAGAIVTLLALTSVSDAQQEGVYTIPHYKFETGQEMDNVKIAYVTYGKLNADKSNAVLLVPGTSSGRHWADDYVGPGKMYDSDKYFFIGVDAVGGGNSTQPKDGLGMDFPRYTIRDIVHTEYHLVHEGLGLNGLHAVAGPSMGSFQGVEWGINYPTFMKGIVMIVPAARSDQHFHSIVDAVIGLITLDPAYKDGKYTENPVEGIKRSGMIYFPWLFGDEYLTTLKEPEPYQGALMAFGTGWSKTWDANALIIRYLASRNHDASAPYDGDMKVALAKIQAKVLLLTSQTDRTIPAYLSRELYAGIKNAQYIEIPTIRGHLGGAAPAKGSAEEAYITSHIRPFLDGL